MILQTFKRATSKHLHSSRSPSPLPQEIMDDLSTKLLSIPVSSAASTALPIVLLNGAVIPTTLRLVDRSCAATAAMVEKHAATLIQREFRSYQVKRSLETFTVEPEPNGDINLGGPHDVFHLSLYRAPASAWPHVFEDMPPDLPLGTAWWYVQKMAMSLCEFVYHHMRKHNSTLDEVRPWLMNPPGSLSTWTSVANVISWGSVKTNAGNEMAIVLALPQRQLAATPALFFAFHEARSIWRSLPRQAFDDLKVIISVWREPSNYVRVIGAEEAYVWEEQTDDALKSFGFFYRECGSGDSWEQR